MYIFHGFLSSQLHNLNFHTHMNYNAKMNIFYKKTIFDKWIKLCYICVNILDTVLQIFFHFTLSISDVSFNKYSYQINDVPNCSNHIGIV